MVIWLNDDDLPDMTGHFETTPVNMIKFQSIMSSQFSAPDNLLREVRENVLGWTQGRLAEVAKGQGNLVSIKTISRLEGGTETYARTTFTKVFLAVSEGLAKAGKPEMDFAKIFPKLISPSDAKKPPMSQKPNPIAVVKTPAENS